MERRGSAAIIAAIIAGIAAGSIACSAVLGIGDLERESAGDGGGQGSPGDLGDGEALGPGEGGAETSVPGFDGAPPVRNDLLVDQSFVAGKRLAGNYLSYAGGPPLLVAIWDTALDAACAFDVAEDGKLRCLPTAVAQDSLTYEDAKCETLVHLQYDACTPPPFSLLADGRFPSCPHRKRMARIGAKRATTDYYFGGNGPRPGSYCASIPTTISSAKAAYDLVPADPKTFVEGTERSVLDAGTGSGRVVPRFVHASDGAITFQGWTDTALAEPCDLGALGDPSRLLCLPKRGLPASPYYEDGQCTARAFAAPSAANGDPPSACEVSAFGFVPKTMPDGCSAGFEAYRHAASITQTYFLKANGKMCVANSSDPAGHYYARGTLAPETTFPATQPLDGGTGRIRPRVVDMRNGFHAAAQNIFGFMFRDTQRNEDCHPFLASDSSVRCMPFGDVFGTRAFRDPGCTQPVTYYMPATSCSGGPVPIAAVIAPSEPGACTVGHRLLSPGPKMAATYSGAPGSCTQVVGQTYEAGAEIPPSVFEPMKLTFPIAGHR